MRLHRAAIGLAAVVLCAGALPYRLAAADAVQDKQRQADALAARIDQLQSTAEQLDRGLQRRPARPPAGSGRRHLGQDEADRARSRALGPAVADVEVRPQLLRLRRRQHRRHHPARPRHAGRRGAGSHGLRRDGDGRQRRHQRPAAGPARGRRPRAQPPSKPSSASSRSSPTPSPRSAPASTRRRRRPRRPSPNVKGDLVQLVAEAEQRRQGGRGRRPAGRDPTSAGGRPGR